MNPVRLVREGDAVTVTLDHRAASNGLDEEIVDLLRAAIAEASAVPDARFLLLCGIKDWFCIGGSGPFMERLLSLTVVERAALSRKVQGIVEDLLECPLLVAALVEGLAAGAGADMVLAADLAFASPDARFALLYAKLGLIPDTGFHLLEWRLGARALLAFAESKVLDQQGLIAAELAEAAPEGGNAAVIRQLRRRFRFAPAAFAAAKRYRNMKIFSDLRETLDAVALQQARLFEVPETRQRLLHSAAAQRGRHQGTAETQEQ